MENYKYLVLRQLMDYGKFKSKAEYARFLGITPQNLAKWFERNTFDVDIIVNKFPEINRVWILTGEGEMLKNTNLNEKNNQNFSSVNISEMLLRLDKKDEQIDKLIETISSQQRTLEQYVKNASAQLDDNAAYAAADKL